VKFAFIDEEKATWPVVATQLGQAVRDLHEKATSRSWPHASQ
jgi:hypothetical protein